jgi:glycosyltransferase involved in cell wall biosynthesis
MPKPLKTFFLTSLTKYSQFTVVPGLRGMALNINQRRQVLHQALQLADRILIDSEVARDIFRRNGFLMPIDIVRYGHDLAWLDQYPGKTPSHAIRFGFIGQIAPMKGPQILIQAFRKLSGIHSARLLIYGNLDKNPGFGQHLRELAQGQVEIEFRGTYPHSASAQVFAEIDVLVVPSLWNDFPLIISEAFATQTPVIASDFGGMAEFIQNEVDGLLFKRGDVQDLARQMERVICETTLLPRLRQGIPRVKPMAEAVQEMTAIYSALLD